MKGYTLAELLIYISVISILTVVLAGVYISVTTSRGVVDARTDVNASLRFAFEKIEQDLRAASAVSSPAVAGQTTQSIIMTVGGANVVYDVSGGQLRRTVNAGTPEILTADTVQVNTTNSPPAFTRIENTHTGFSPVRTQASITVQMTFMSAAPGNNFSASKKATVVVR